MNASDPKSVRRSIMRVLYESYQHDPLQMMTPSDIADAAALLIDQLAPNCHYLHDRNLIELMMGYNPPLFAAARISPEGIDLYEDRKRFQEYFALGTSHDGAGLRRVVRATFELAEQAEYAPLEGLRKEWLLRDITRLREMLRRPESEWDAAGILNALHWLAGFEVSGDLPALADLESMLRERLG